MKKALTLVSILFLLTFDLHSKVEFNFLIGQTFESPGIEFIKPDVSFGVNINLIENKSRFGLKLIYDEYQFMPDGLNISLLGFGGMLPVYTDKRGSLYVIPKLLFDTNGMELLYAGLSGSFALNITEPLSGIFQFTISSHNFKQFYNTFLFGLGISF